MSLSRAAARIAARYALLGNTVAEDRVFDSAISPIDVTLGKHMKPIIIVATDDDEMVVEGRDLSQGERQTEIVIMIAVTGVTKVESGDVSLSIMQSDEGLDLTLDILEHQVLSVLKESTGPWADAFRAMTPRFMATASKRGAGDDGVKFAARQIILTADLMGTPVSGQPIIDGSAWDVWLTTAESEWTLSETAALMRSLIEGDLLDDWEVARRALGLPEWSAIGLGPTIITDSDEHTLSTLTVRHTDPGGDSFDVTEEP